MITLDDVREARRNILGIAHRTPLFHSEAIGAQAGVEVYLKCENLQKTGSFKPRGALNKLAHLSKEEKARGVVTVSAGNHAQGLAFAARRAGIKCTVVMPTDAPQAKLDAAKGYGAEVIQHGNHETMSSMFDKMDELVRERGFVVAHPFNDPFIIAGQATIGMEILEDLPDVDYVLVPIGGGGLISGISSSIKLISPRTEVIGIESEAGPAMQASVKEGKVAHIHRAPSIADGMGAPFVGDLTLEIAKKNVDRYVTVTDSEIIIGMKWILQRAKLLVEGAGAAAVGALLTGRANIPRNARVVCVLSGGNVDLARVSEWIR